MAHILLDQISSTEMLCGDKYDTDALRRKIDAKTRGTEHLAQSIGHLAAGQ